MKTNVFQALGLFLVSTAFTFAQQRFSISVTSTPVVSHANTRINLLIPDPNGQLISATVQREFSAAGYAVGLMAHYAFTPKWSVSTGVWYNRVGRNQPFPFETGDIPGRAIQKDWQIPLLLNYRSSQKRLSPYFSAGVLANSPDATIFRKKTGADPRSVTVRFNQSVDYRAVLGAGVSYKLNERLSLIAQPLLIWRFQPAGDYERYVAYQVNGQIQLMYSF